MLNRNVQVGRSDIYHLSYYDHPGEPRNTMEKHNLYNLSPGEF